MKKKKIFILCLVLIVVVFVCDSFVLVGVVL
jgi:hypothetical protein